MQFDKVLALVTGESSDANAVAHASDLVREGRGRLVILYVIRMDRSLPLDAEMPEQVQRAEQALQAAEQIARLPRNDIEAEMLQARDIGAAVVHEAAVRDVDAVVIGTPYPRRLGGFSLGTDIPYVLEYAACHVILLREGIPGARPERRELTARLNTRSG
jgi:nucleotide-binding universal stress UspA family protein